MIKKIAWIGINAGFQTMMIWLLYDWFREPDRISAKEAYQTAAKTVKADYPQTSLWEIKTGDWELGRKERHRLVDEQGKSVYWDIRMYASKQEKRDEIIAVKVKEGKPDKVSNLSYLINKDELNQAIPLNSWKIDSTDAARHRK